MSCEPIYEKQQYSISRRDSSLMVMVRQEHSMTFGIMKTSWNRALLALCRKPTKSPKLSQNRHAGYFPNIFNISKIFDSNMQCFSKCPLRYPLCFSCCFYICSKGFKSRTFFNYRHISSPMYIVQFIFALWDDGLCALTTLYSYSFWTVQTLLMSHFIYLPSGRKEKKPLLGSHFSCPKSPSAALIFRAAIFFFNLSGLAAHRRKPS